MAHLAGSEEREARYKIIKNSLPDGKEEEERSRRLCRLSRNLSLDSLLGQEAGSFGWFLSFLNLGLDLSRPGSLCGFLVGHLLNDWPC